MNGFADITTQLIWQNVNKKKYRIKATIFNWVVT